MSHQRANRLGWVLAPFVAFIVMLFVVLLSGCAFSVATPYGSVSVRGDGKTSVELDGKAVVKLLNER